MGKKVLSVLLALVMVFSMGSMGVLAAEVVETPEENYEPIGIVPAINRYITCLILAGGGWVRIEGDNNVFPENVAVTNASNKEIEIKAFNGSGTQQGSTMTVKANEFTTFYFGFASGTYYFEARFTDYSAGYITIWCYTT